LPSRKPPDQTNNLYTYMKKEKSIKELFEGMHAGKLTATESAMLMKAVNPVTPPLDVNEYYKDQWNKASENGEIPNGKGLLKRIYRRLGMNNPSVKDTNTLYLTWMKYAAIVLFAFAAGRSVSWLTAPDQMVQTVSEPFMNEVSVEYGSKSQIILPDGTKVKLNSGSKLTYPSQFDSDMRKVQLEGEAFFNVAKETDRPFFVNTGSIAIKVLGTSFNVKSYTEENIIETTLESGAIEIYNEPAEWGTAMNRAPIAVLKPKDKATYVKDISAISVNSELKIPENLPALEKKAGILVENQIETALFTAWKDNVLRFKGEKFEHIAIKLERWYDVKIDIRHKTLKEEFFTGQFDSETIEQALEALKLTAPFRYSITKNEIIIY
jgi:transmembrane sensor